ncbi:MAG: penicillin acylase family protein, partial [Candidatus Acidiferrum sp.]
MKKFVLALVLATAACPFGSQATARIGGVGTAADQAAKNPEAARWEHEAASVTITRDDWGIAHVHGKADADAVFGMIYAQAEDDFNRVETNY